MLKADKGSAMVLLSNSQYLHKVYSHINESKTYRKLAKDPTASVARKLDVLLKALHKEGQISKDYYDKCRITNSRCPQLYGAPKVHKEGCPIRPVVTFYNTPLSALHKTLSILIKPLTNNPMKLRNTQDFVSRLQGLPNTEYNYFVSVDVKSLYTSCDMRKAKASIINRFNENPEYLPADFTTKAMNALLNFALDNSFFEFNHEYYAQDEGGPMGSPLTVVMAEVRVIDNEERAFATCTDPPSLHVHFVDDGFSPCRDAQHAEAWLSHLNSSSDDLQYTIEHPKNGYLPFLNVLIHPNKSTSVYRKATHTNVYLNSGSSTTHQAKDSVIRSLTRQAYEVCSPEHLAEELSFVKNTCLNNGFLNRRIDHIMNQVNESISHPVIHKPKKSPGIRHVTIPFVPGISPNIRSILNKYDVDVSFSSTSTLASMLTTTISRPSPENTRNVVYEIPCHECEDVYHGQTKRPVNVRINEHEAATRLNHPDDSATAEHAIECNHTIDYNGTKIIKTVKKAQHLDLAEYIVIKKERPAMNRNKPEVNPVYQALCPLINTDRRMPAEIEIKPKRKRKEKVDS